MKYILPVLIAMVFIFTSCETEPKKDILTDEQISAAWDSFLVVHQEPLAGMFDQITADLEDAYDSELPEEIDSILEFPDKLVFTSWEELPDMTTRPYEAKNAIMIPSEVFLGKLDYEWEVDYTDDYALVDDAMEWMENGYEPRGYDQEDKTRNFRQDMKKLEILENIRYIAAYHEWLVLPPKALADGTFETGAWIGILFLIDREKDEVVDYAEMFVMNSETVSYSTYKTYGTDTIALQKACREDLKEHIHTAAWELVENGGDVEDSKYHVTKEDDTKADAGTDESAEDGEAGE